jgi:hypothetical protein
MDLTKKVAKELFGGVRPMSQETGIPESTINHAIATNSATVNRAFRLLMSVMGVLLGEIGAENTRFVIKKAKEACDGK